jgi:predicted nucleic acid-binding protein
MRPALDSNVLLYGFLEPDSERGAIANDVVQRSAGQGVLPIQALGEFLWVVRRRRPDWLERAIQRSGRLRLLFSTVDTDYALIQGAGELAARHNLKFWDAVILQASARGGAKLLLSEDMQDGSGPAGVRIVNPFNPANAALLDRLLPR